MKCYVWLVTSVVTQRCVLREALVKTENSFSHTLYFLSAPPTSISPSAEAEKHVVTIRRHPANARVQSGTRLFELSFRLAWVGCLWIWDLTRRQNCIVVRLPGRPSGGFSHLAAVSAAKKREKKGKSMMKMRLGDYKYRADCGAHKQWGNDTLGTILSASPVWSPRNAATWNRAGRLLASESSFKLAQLALHGTRARAPAALLLQPVWPGGTTEEQ